MTKKAVVVVIFLCLVIIHLSVNASASSYASQAEEMENKIGSLTGEQPYAFVDLGFSSFENSCIDKLNVQEAAEHSRFGNLELLSEELPVFLSTIGDNDDKISHCIADVIARTALSIVEASGKETAWVTIRSITPMKEYDIPRWHQDGYYYAPFSGFAFKFAAVLTGASTLFYPLPKEMLEVFQQNYDNREFLSNLLDPALVKTVPEKMGVVFTVGDSNRSAVHSEPPIHEPRLFFSVLPGTQDEIQELYALWHPK